MFMAARMIQAGYKIAYCAEASVRHSHNYTPKQEFQRYFDTGYFMPVTLGFSVTLAEPVVRVSAS